LPRLTLNCHPSRRSVALSSAQYGFCGAGDLLFDRLAQQIACTANQLLKFRPLSRLRKEWLFLKAFPLRFVGLHSLRKRAKGMRRN
jgi:hypothetical protein